MLVIIVTHNSQAVLPRCLEALAAQTARPARIIIVDSGSTDRSYLPAASEDTNLTVLHRANIGFAAANNAGLALVESDPHYVAFVNPDSFLEPDCLAVAAIKLEQNPGAGAVSGTLCGYDPVQDRPTGTVDSTGIYRTWYGRWYDRDRGTNVALLARPASRPPALCGALMICRFQAVQELMPTVFDESFFLYKEDIDLSLRLRKNGWQLFYFPEIRAFHCRGWSRIRQAMSRDARLLSAKNELRLTLKHRSPYLVWAFLKYILVRAVDV